MRFFSSYKEAHETLSLPGSLQRGTIGTETTGISSLKLTANPKSLDRISRDWSRIYYVGRGKKKSPGEPLESQELKDQAAFQTSLRLKTPIPILVKLKPGVIVYPGDYQVVSIRRVPGVKEIEYYQITLVKVPESKDHR